MNKNQKVIKVEIKNGSLYNRETGDFISPKEIKAHQKGVEYKIVNVKDQLAMGVAINPYRRTSVDYIDNLYDYKNIESIYKQIEVSNKLFLLEDVISTTLEIMIDFTITSFYIEGIPDEKKHIIEWWIDNINKTSDRYEPFGLKLLTESMAYEDFISGNTFPWEVWEDIEIEGTFVSLPTKIKLLNPRTIRIDENKFAIGEPEYFLSPGLISTKMTLNQLIRDVNFGKTANHLFKNIKISRNQREIPLDSKFLSHIKRRARDYEMWGKPYLTKAVQAVAYKQKLMKLDKQTVEGLINMVTIFKVGSPDPKSPYHKVPPERLNQLASLLGSPKATTMLVWAHDIDIITTGPEGEILNFTDKYKDANLWITRALGVPPVLLDGTGNATVAWIAVISLVKRLEKVRERIENYILFVLDKICRENDWNCIPKIRWSPTSLRDDRTIKTLLLAFYDRGLLPIQVMHEESGKNHEEMIRLKEIEKKSNLRELFNKPAIPFDSPRNVNPGDMGRPVDRTKIKEDDKIHANFINPNFISDKIKEKFKSDVFGILNKLEDEILNIEGRRGKVKIDLAVSARFLRLGQVASIYASFDSENLVPEMEVKLSRWMSDHLENLKKFVTSNLIKISSKKINDDEKSLFIKGIFSEAKRRAIMFMNESMVNIGLAKEISKNKRDGKVGAIFHANQDTKCELCRQADGNYMTMDKLFELPFHPFQHFTLTFLTESPILKGTKKNKIIVRDPKRKSRML